jgi:hypothetical protein
MNAISRTIVGTFLIFAALLFPMPSAPAQGSAFAACVREAAKRDLAGKEAFQTGVRDLIAAEKPKFEALASLHMSHQIALARLRAAKMAYLAEHDPGRIKTESLAKFRNFDWSPADDAALAGEDAETAALLARVADLRKKNDANRDWPKLREFMRGELMPGPDFRGLMAELAKNDRAVRAGLKDCPRG